MLKVFNILLLNKYSIVFTSRVKISEQYVGYFAMYSLHKGSKSKVTKMEFRLKNSEYDQEIPQSQTADNPWHREEEPLNHHETPGRQIKQSDQLSLPH